MLMSNGNMVIVLHHCLSQKTEPSFLVVSGRGRGEESWLLGLIPVILPRVLLVAPLRLQCPVGWGSPW